MGFYRVENSLYLGGATDFDKRFSNFRKIRPNGEHTELQQMPTPKHLFAMTLWKKRDSLFTLGG